MANRPRGSSLYKKSIQIFVTEEDHTAFKQYADERHQGNLSVAGRQVLKRALMEQGFGELQAS